MSGRDPTRLPAEDAGKLYLQYGEKLVAFAWGLLKDVELAREVVQVTFGRALESAGEVSSESLRAWLFRVAYNEAMAVRRRQGIEGRALRKLSGGGPDEHTKDTRQAPDEELVRWEQVRRVRDVLDQLPADQREVVRRRIYENQKFAEIAEELALPLGTVLTRMRLALAKLQKALHERESE